MPEALKFDYRKVEKYDAVFRRLKRELFPDGEYQYRNEACSAFAYLLSVRVRRDFGQNPLNIWCDKSEISDDLFHELKQNAPAALRGIGAKEELPSLIVARVPGNNTTGVDYLMWREHHVAMCLDLPVYQNSAKCERLVFDPVLFAEPVREKDWLNALNTSPVYTRCTPAEPYSRELEAKARLMLKQIRREAPVNLLRSPGNPDPQADLGHHSFTYSFLPHEGGLTGSEVMQEAACLNRAPLVLPGRSEALMLPCRLVGGAGASLEVLKLAYKRNERIIRVVETDGCNSIARLALEPGRKLVETNLVEWSSGATLKPEDGVVEVPLKPFEIRTFRIR